MKLWDIHELGNMENSSTFQHSMIFQIFLYIPDIKVRTAAPDY